MPLKNLDKYRIILASGSPRRQELCAQMGLTFEVLLKPIAEDFPPDLKAAEISDHLAYEKAKAFLPGLRKNELLITADTIVWFEETVWNKPANRKEAHEMLMRFSGKWHEVYTSVCLTLNGHSEVVNDCTKVRFAQLSTGEIDHYINSNSPFDKAGGYGIQDWIGLIGVPEISGSYTNVLGFPTQLVYKTLMSMVD